MRFLQGFNGWEAKHVRRCSNGAVHSLAKYAKFVFDCVIWVEDSPNNRKPSLFGRIHIGHLPQLMKFFMHWLSKKKKKKKIYEINHRICYMIYQDGLNSFVLYSWLSKSQFGS